MKLFNTLALAATICLGASASAQETVKITLQPSPHGKVIVTPEIPADGVVKTGTVLKVVAAPDAGWVFDSAYTRTGWMPYAERMYPIFEVVADKDMAIGASFVEPWRLEGYRTIQDVVYAKPGVKPLKYDVFIPNGAKNLPGIVIIHGGGWSSNTEDIMRGLARELINDGKYVVCSIDYRWLNQLDGDEVPVTMANLIEDCYGAILHIQEHAADYGMDPTRLAVTGDSAGGHLSASMATMVERIGDGGFGVKEGVYEYMPTYMPAGMTTAQARRIPTWGAAKPAPLASRTVCCISLSSRCRRPLNSVTGRQTLFRTGSPCFTIFLSAIIASLFFLYHIVYGFLSAVTVTVRLSGAC